jgi:phage protein D
MARTPFFKVLIQKTGRDISSLISRFSYELAVDQDNLLSLDIRDSKTDIIDDPDLKEGEVLSLSFGYLGGKTSQTYLARISDVIANYQDIISITIRATDLGITMKKGASKKIWKNVRASDIAKSIALANGLAAVVESTPQVYPNIPQGAKSDYEFLKYLESIEKDGSWRFYLRSNELHYTRLKLESESRTTYGYNDANGFVKLFRPYSQELLKDTASRDTVVTTVDPFTNQAVQNVVNNSTAKDDVKLGKFVYNMNAVNIGYGKNTLTGKSSSNLDVRPSQVKKSQEDPNKSGSIIFSPARNIDEGINAANKRKKSKSLSDYMANLTIEGDPDAVEDCVITMSGVAKKDTGNWYVSRVAHVISSDNSYETRFALNKNAGKKVTSDETTEQKKVNDTVGKPKTEDAPVKKEVKIYFNQDGIEIDRR